MNSFTYRAVFMHLLMIIQLRAMDSRTLSDSRSSIDPENILNVVCQGINIHASVRKKFKQYVDDLYNKHVRLRATDTFDGQLTWPLICRAIERQKKDAIHDIFMRISYEISKKNREKASNFSLMTYCYVGFSFLTVMSGLYIGSMRECLLL